MARSIVSGTWVVVVYPQSSLEQAKPVAMLFVKHTVQFTKLVPLQRLGGDTKKFGNDTIKVFTELLHKYRCLVILFQLGLTSFFR